MTELALGIRYLHSLDLIHGDIKPSNAMIGTVTTYPLVTRVSP